MAQRFCQIGHFVKILRAGLVHPTHNLFGTERFFAHIGKMSGQPLKVVVEQIGFHVFVFFLNQGFK
ncbi:Uncharacterised protein [Neisseria meningitidis]|nr:Uncharacterised protein [Neisseria meningitidis]